MRIDLRHATIWPVIIDGKYGMRINGVDYLVSLPNLAAVLFKGWRN